MSKLKILGLIPILIMLTLIVMWFLLINIDEPQRVYTWYLLRKLMRIVGFIFLIGSLVYILLKKLPRTVLTPLTMLLAIISILFPMLTKRFGMAYPASLENTAPNLTIRLPLDEKAIISWGGNSVKTNYHAAYPNQRWAYDLVVEPHSMRSKNLEDYGCFGKTVIAPISGKILKVINSDPDQIPSQKLTPPSNVFGNHVLIQPNGTEHKLLIAHMKKDSIVVAKNDVITEGQAIGQCGNSGNTSEPHIHIHYAQTQQAKNGLYYTTGLPLYFRNHGGNPMPIGGFKRKGGMIIWLNEGVQHIQK